MANLQQKQDLTGKKYSRLYVVQFHSIKRKRRTWLCKCDCGKEVLVTTTNLISGNSKSCGCYSRELASQRAATHRKTNTSEYRSWANMISRCTCKTRKDYYRYGGRGITVCESWETFINFYNDMGTKPSPKHTLERIDNDKGYCKSNCRWATMKEQSNNRSSTRFDEVDGITMTRTDVANRIGITRKTLYKYYELGFTGQQISSIFDKNEKGKIHRKISLLDIF